jgi:hypothetical protein
MRTRSGFLSVLVLLLTLGGCDKDSPTGPSADNIAGKWTGTATYPNAPFELTLTQTGAILRGQYRDQLDTSSAVTGTFTPPTFAIVVDFGDAKLNIQGTVRDARTADGNMFTSALGNQMFPFVMSR